jgi:flagellar biosynthesis component FlhA
MSQDFKGPGATAALQITPALKLGESPMRAISKEASSRLSELLGVLGIPGDGSVEIAVANNQDRLLRLGVNGKRCFFPDELLWRVHSYISGTSLNEVQSVELLKAAVADPVQFLVLSSLEIVKQQPASLFGFDQCAAYQACLPIPDPPPQGWPPPPDWLLPILSQVLSLGLSIADRQAVANVLCEAVGKKRSRHEVVEDLIVALHTDLVEIRLPREYLRQITTADGWSGQDRFALMRDGLFYELGLRYPNFRLVLEADLKPGSFEFKINHVTSLPRIGLRQDQVLVNDSPDRLRLLGIQGKPAVNPANGNPCACIDPKDEPTAASAGLTTWNQIGYLVLCMAGDLRAHGASFINRQSAQYEVDQLASAFPALVQAVQTKYSIEQVTQVLRILIAEDISIRNLRLILESLLDYDHIVTDPSKFIIFDARLPFRQKPDAASLTHPAHLAEFVRTGLKRYISHKYTRGGNTLVVYLLDSEIERILSDHLEKGSDLADEDREQILEAVRSKVGTLPPTGSPPVILTIVNLRALARKAIMPEFPRLPVLSYSELSPDMNIQPIVRISLD